MENTLDNQLRGREGGFWSRNSGVPSVVASLCGHQPWYGSARWQVVGRKVTLSSHGVWEAKDGRSLNSNILAKGTPQMPNDKSLPIRLCHLPLALKTHEQKHRALLRTQPSRGYDRTPCCDLKQHNMEKPSRVNSTPPTLGGPSAA